MFWLFFLFCLKHGFYFQELSNALRGFPLNGRKFKTPDGVLGVVYEENKTKLSEANRTLKVNSVFNEYVYWNYDKIPSDNDALIKALDWIEISKSVRTLHFSLECEHELLSLQSDELGLMIVQSL